MKKIYFLLFTVLISAAGFGQTTVFTESFETDGNGTRYTTSIPEFSDGFGDFFGRTNLNDTAEDSADLIVGNVYSLSQTDGNFCFAGMDIDAANPAGSGGAGTETLTFTGINISGFNNLSLAILLAEDDDGSNQDWDANTSFTVEINVDGAGFNTILQVAAEGGTNTEPAIDTNFDGVGDGTKLSSVFQEFTANISSGSSLDMRLTFANLDAGDEDISIDNIRIIDGFAATPSITITSPSGGTEFAPGTTSVDVEWTTANTTGGEFVNITVNSTTTTNAMSPFTIATTDGTTYDVLVELADQGGTLDDSMVSFSVQQIATVASVAELRMGTVNEFYTLTGEAILTYQQSNRNQKIIEDAPGSSMSAGIVIDDSAGTVTTTYNLGDGITGITGELTEFGGTLQFVPSSDTGAATSTGNALTPQTVTLTDLNNDAESFESELVQVLAVTMDNSTNTTFTTGSEIPITDQGMNTFNFRTSFFDADYVDANVPTMATDITGIISERFGPYFITARNAADFSVQVLSTDNFETNNFSMYPNPTNTGEVTIASINTASIAVTVFDVLGKQVKNETISNNRLNVSNLKAGIYLLRLTQDNATTTKKLVIN